jgi:hypothetical protein
LVSRKKKKEEKKKNGETLFLIIKIETTQSCKRSQFPPSNPRSQSMSHHYPTRFQLKKAQEQPLQATMTRLYPTRFQLKKAQKAQAQPIQAQPSHTSQARPLKVGQKAPLQVQPLQSMEGQADAVQDELKLMRQREESSAVVNYFLARVAASKSLLDKVLETIKLFEHLYEHPVLLTTHLRMKDVVWHKMAQLDSELTNALMCIPSTLDIDLYVLATRTNIARLHNLMNMIRQKYY